MAKKRKLPVDLRGYTLVHHSGLPNAVEEASVESIKTAKAILKEGGVIYPSYTAASDAAMGENYPPEVKNIYPRCRGRFGKTRVGGLRVYIPSVKNPIDNSNPETKSEYRTALANFLEK